MSETSERASIGRLAVFIMLGFTLVFGVTAALVWIFWLLYTGEGDVGQEGGRAALGMLMHSVVGSLPISVCALVVLSFWRKTKAIDSLGGFLSAILIAMIAFWIIVALYGLVTGGVDSMQQLASLAAAVPPIGILSGAILWQLRALFGITRL